MQSNITFLPLSKQHSKWVRKLQQKKYRREEKLFLAEGLNSLHAAIEAPHHPVREIIVDHEFAEKIKDNPSLLPVSPTIPVYECSNSEMKGVSSEETPQGVVIVCHQKEFSFDNVKNNLNDTLIYCEGISDPGNLGTIIRSSAWFGYRRILAGPFCVDPFNTKVIRSSAGTFFGVEVYQPIDRDMLVELAAHAGYTLIAAVPSGGIPLHQWKKPEKTIVMFGHESKGLSPHLAEQADQVISIPGCGTVESLNLSVAASIILYKISANQDGLEGE